MSELNWTEAQWSRIVEAIDSEVENSRLAHKVIPEYTLPHSARTVARNRFDYAAGTIDETHEGLAQITEDFFLTRLQTEDEDLGNARLRVRRAAQQLARKCDSAVFQSAIRDEIEKNQGVPGFQNRVEIPAPFPDGVVSATSQAVALLDGEGYRSGFVMVAGQGVYTQLHTRANGAADFPRKAVEGLLEEGPVHRSAVLDPGEALILSLSGEEIDRAVAEGPTLEFLRIGRDENREFRLYERFLTRFKQTAAAVLLRLGAVG
ncbi:encapsulin [Geodermatophilus sp. SYSU D00703]